MRLQARCLMWAHVHLQIERLATMQDTFGMADRVQVWSICFDFEGCMTFFTAEALQANAAGQYMPCLVLKSNALAAGGQEGHLRPSSDLTNSSYFTQLTRCIYHQLSC